MSERDLAEYGGAILLHERAHLRLRHSLDLIVTDVAGCLQWFNPAMWLLRREVGPGGYRSRESRDRSRPRRVETGPQVYEFR